MVSKWIANPSSVTAVRVRFSATPPYSLKESNSMVEIWPPKPKVAGSSPVSPAK